MTEVDRTAYKNPWHPYANSYEFAAAMGRKESGRGTARREIVQTATRRSRVVRTPTEIEKRAVRRDLELLRVLEGELRMNRPSRVAEEHQLDLTRVSHVANVLRLAPDAFSLLKEQRVTIEVASVIARLFPAELHAHLAHLWIEGEVDVTVLRAKNLASGSGSLKDRFAAFSIPWPEGLG